MSETECALLSLKSRDVKKLVSILNIKAMNEEMWSLSYSKALGSGKSEIIN